MHANFTAEVFLGRLNDHRPRFSRICSASSYAPFGDAWRESINIQAVVGQGRIIVTRPLPGSAVVIFFFLSLFLMHNRSNEWKSDTCRFSKSSRSSSKSRQTNYSLFSYLIFLSLIRAVLLVTHACNLMHELEKCLWITLSARRERPPDAVIVETLPSRK